jgi:hypothetical protein
MTKNSEGTKIKLFGYQQSPVVAPIESFRADVQPYRLTEANLEQWGLSNKDADAKKMFYDEISVNIKINNRVSVVSDFDNSLIYYDIKGTNPWPTHMEAILIPVQGE